MALGPKDPIKVAALIKATKAKADGRKVSIRTKSEGPQPGMPGSKGPASLQEVVISATPTEKAKKMGELKEQAISVAGFGGKSTPYKKGELVSSMRKMGLNKEADAINSMKETVRGDLSDIVNKVVSKFKLEPYK